MTQQAATTKPAFEIFADGLGLVTTTRDPTHAVDIAIREAQHGHPTAIHVIGFPGEYPVASDADAAYVLGVLSNWPPGSIG